MRLVLASLVFFALLPLALAAPTLDPGQLTVNYTNSDLYLQPGETITFSANCEILNEDATNLEFEFLIPESDFTYLGGADTEIWWGPEITDIPLTEFNPPDDSLAPLADPNYAYAGDYLEIFNLDFLIATEAQNFENTFTGQFFAEGTESSILTRKIFLDLNPHILTAEFSQPTLINDGVDALTLTVTVLDYNGCDNLATGSVTVDLTDLGHSAAEPLTFISCENNLAVFQLSSITTQVEPGYKEFFLTAFDADAHQNDPTDPNFSLNDLPENKITLDIDLADGPQVQDLAISDAAIGGPSQTSAELTWTATNGTAETKIILGSDADCSSGTILQDWISSSDGAQSLTILADDLIEGENILTVCGAKPATSRSAIGSDFIIITLDTTPATLTKINVTPVYSSYNNIHFLWQANEIGSYTTSLNSEAEQAAQDYVTPHAEIHTIFLRSELVDDLNTVRIHFTDAAGNTSELTQSVYKVSDPTDITNVVLSDEDMSNEGLDGRDFTVRWDKPNYDYIESYLFFILPATITLDYFNANYAYYVETAIYANPDATEWTGTEGIRRDSPGRLITDGTYQVFMLLVSLSGERSVVAVSNSIYITGEDFTQPTIVSLTFAEAENTLQIDWSEDMQANAPDLINFLLTNGSLGTDPIFIWQSPETLLIELGSDGFISAETILGLDVSAEEVFCDLASPENCVDSSLALPEITIGSLNLAPVITEFLLTGETSFYNTTKIPLASFLVTDPEGQAVSYNITETQATPELVSFTETVPTTYTLSGDWEGEWELFAWAVDEQGKFAEPAIALLTLDQTPPELTFSLAAGEYSTAQNLTLSCSDALIGVAEILYSLTEAEAPNILYETILTISEDTVLTAQCFDKAGNSVTKSATYTFTEVTATTSSSSSSGSGWAPEVTSTSETLNLAITQGVIPQKLIHFAEEDPGLNVEYAADIEISDSNGENFTDLIYAPRVVLLQSTVSTGQELVPLSGAHLAAESAMEFSEAPILSLPLPNVTFFAELNVYLYDPEQTAYVLVDSIISSNETKITVAITEFGIYAVFRSSAEILEFEPPTYHAAAQGFSDVNTEDWFFESVMRLAQLGLVKGYADGTFRPGDLITRAELVTILAKLHNLELPSELSVKPFPDVEITDSFARIIAKAKEIVWIHGYDDGYFRPHQNITRAETLKILFFIEKPDQIFPNLSNFRDVLSTDWFFNYLNFALKNQLVQGYPDGTFQPDASITRAEFATIIARSL